jgi:hypothetical protein
VGNSKQRGWVGMTASSVEVAKREKKEVNKNISGDA